MSRELKMQAWLASNEDTIVSLFTQVSLEESRFPHFARLSTERIQSAMLREYRGLIMFLSSDERGLQIVTDSHRRDIDDFLRHIPIDEQFAFFKERGRIFREVVSGDEETLDYRDLLFRRLELAGRYYEATTMVLETERRLSQLPGF